MVREIKARGIPHVKTVSNGMLLTKVLSHDIIASGLDAIEFSLDGESIDDNNAIRRNCDGVKVLSNISALIEEKKRLGSKTPAIYVATTQFKKKRDDFQEQPITTPAYIAEILGSYVADIAGFKSTFAMRWPDLIVDKTLYEVITDPASKVIDACDHANSTMTIRWNGDVVPCCYDLTSRNVLGNILKDSVETIWNGPQFQQLRQNIFNKQTTEPCRRCNVLNPDDFLLRLTATKTR